MNFGCLSSRICRALSKVTQRCYVIKNLEQSRCVCILNNLYKQQCNTINHSSMYTSTTQKTEILIDLSVTIEELAKHVKVPTGKIVKLARDAGEKVDRGIKTVLKPEIAELLLLEYGLVATYQDQQFNISPRPPACDNDSLLQSRAPVVTIMGHVDHGKTTLLDALKNTSVASAEAGGITQHIGAFSAKVPGSGSKITFIDTPGHAAFQTMRARGAHVTDVVVLVVAADDGVMPQTIESINHANDAKVPLIVAINKIDKHKVDVDRVKSQLLGHGIQLEEFGGDVQTVEISATKWLNLTDLTEAIITHAEVHNLRAEFDGLAEGVVLESKIEKGLGPVATVLVQRGTLRKGAVVVAGTTQGKVRQMLDDDGKVVGAAIPSAPVLVSGWKDLPEAGEQLLEVTSESFANKVVSYRKSKLQSMRVFGPSLTDNDDLPVMMQNFTKNYDHSDKLDIVVKGDVNGSVEAFLDAIATYKGNNPKLSVLASGVGNITENDLRLVQPFKGMIFCFNVGVSRDMKKLAEQLEVKIHSEKVIYHLLQKLKDEMSAKLPLLYEEVALGEATVLKVFKLTGKRKATIAGCRVKQGQINKHATYRIYRSKNIVFEGALTSMKRGEEDTDVVKKETECGLCFDNFQDVHEGDRIECFKKTSKAQEVDWKWNF